MGKTRNFLKKQTMVIVQKCVFTGSEMISDAFATEDAYDGCVKKCKSEMIDKKAMKFDIGDSDDVNDEDTTVNNVVDGFEMTGVTLKKGNSKPISKNSWEKLKVISKKKTLIELNLL